MIKKLLILATGVFAVLTIQAKEQPDSALYNRFQRLFAAESPDSTEVFYQLSAKLQQFYKQHGQMEDYYHTRRVEVRYEADRHNFFDAIKKGNALLVEMKRNGDAEKYGDIAYSSLGTVYNRQGNYEMAARYFNDALRTVSPDDTIRFIHASAGLAHAYVVTNPDRALELNERLGELLKMDSTYYKVYLAHKVQIYFYKGDKENFLKAVQDYEALLKKPDAPKYHYGEHTIGVMESAMTDKHDEVLRNLNAFSNHPSHFGASVRIYEQIGRPDLALAEMHRRAKMQDSFSNDLISENLDELYESLGINELQRKAAKEREFLMTCVIVLLVVAIALLVSRYFIRRRFQKQILHQNEQLEIALDEAKESERMKATFIQHVSHEMRTPMNIINGYSQIIADPNYELDKENREALLQAIDQNTMAMTTIINDLLEISNDSSKERYPRDQHIVLADFCRNIMSRADAKNKGRLELKFTSTLPDDFVFYSNSEGVERILKQLLKNARLNTEHGSIELSVSQTTDGSSLQFAVTDTGIGIPEEHQEHIFEQFYKVNAFKPGLGVGLSVARKIAIRLGGTLVLAPTYKSGARFILTIPIEKGKSEFSLKSNPHTP